MCSKRRLRDEIAAKIALEGQKKNAHRKQKECERYYFCNRCKGFHLTSESEEEYLMKKMARQEPTKLKRNGRWGNII